MYKNRVYGAACGLSLLLSPAISHANDNIDYIDIKVAFTGNTAEGKIVKRNTNYKMYFHPSGSLVRLDNNQTLEKGRWSINSKNELCLNFDSEVCSVIKKRADEKFDLYNQKGDLELTIEKVTLGNPDKLNPL